MNTRLKQSIRIVVEHLVAGKFFELEAITSGRRLSALEATNAVSAYGRELITPPEDAYELMNVVEVRNAKPARWSVSMPLWTREEGRSDLSIEVTLVSDGDGFRIELDDIHVL